MSILILYSSLMYICWTDEEVAKGSLKFDNEVRRERKWPFLSNSSRDAAEFHGKSRWVLAEGRVRYTIMSPICLKRKVQFQLEYYCQARYFFFVPEKSINEQIFWNCKSACIFFKEVIPIYNFELCSGCHIVLVIYF